MQSVPAIQKTQPLPFPIACVRATLGSAYRFPRRCQQRSAQMTQHVYKVVEIVGTSEESVSKAIDRAIEKASSSLRNLGWFEVNQVRGHIEDGKVAHYQVTMKVGFRLEE
jgi:flavin-binding protein dodecin